MYCTKLEEGAEDRPTFQHLVDPLDSEETADNKRESIVVAPESQEQVQDHQQQQQQNQQQQPIQLKLPLQLDFDELAGSLIEKNQRSRMNCVVEKRRAEEVMDHQPKTVRLPFGVNLTTDPRYEHVTGERMAIFCESGNDQRHVPMEPQQQQQVPMMVPIAVHQIQVPIPPQQQHQMPHHLNAMPYHHPNAIPVQHGGNGLPFQMAPQHQPIHHGNFMAAHPHNGMPVHQMQVQQSQPQPQHIPAQFFAHMAQKPHFQPVQQQQQQRVPQMIPEEQVIIQEEVIPFFQDLESRVPEADVVIPEGRVLMAEGRAMRHPQQSVVIAKEMVHENVPDVPADTVKPPPPPFHRLPIHVSVETPEEHVARQQQQTQQEAQPRPHFVQPRSIRSVDAVFDHHRDKRVRRCACDCAC
ncbi:hypothetical protein O3M35_011157 [Rhynocoris fuscipes]|uniref:Uncharacterized protein n=2 Tax=Rhynocoris fuscipes TaxID=488301 RepID=A0AAW1CZQ7_9HEMI